MAARRIVLFGFLTALLMIASGCATPTQRAEALFGRWESGRTVLVFTRHGLYGLYHQNLYAAGQFGVAGAGKLVVERSVGSYTSRNLWQFKQADKTHLSLTLPSGQKIDLTRGKTAAPADPKVVGLWQAPLGLSHWNFYEFTAEGDYVQIHWLFDRNNATRPRRRVTVGRVRTDGDKLHLDRHNDLSRSLIYQASGDTLSLKPGPNGQESVYRRVEDARLLEKGDT